MAFDGSSAVNLELGLVGNGRVAGLIDEHGSYAWLCLPRFDGEPVFNRLLGGDGRFDITLRGVVRSEQAYLKNTGVVETILEAEDGSKIRIVDFTPAFRDRGRMFRPASVCRRVEPLAGMPIVSFRLAPDTGRGSAKAPARRGVSHIRFHDEAADYRVTTDAPVSYLVDAREFVLERAVNFVLGPDESLSEQPGALVEKWLDATTRYWRDWSRRLATPPDWQDAVIRAAITLKMCVFEETGGVVAALTTSIPEHAGSERNWDYRFCWLRDAYFTVTALNRLAAVGTLEKYLGYLRNAVAHTQGGHVRPVYGVALEENLDEETAAALPGYRGHAPVRFGNQAAEHVQHDVYGHIILGASQAFFDQRIDARAGPLEFAHFEQVGERAFEVRDTPDAGIWEYRGRADVHTSSAMMCWAACDRLSKIAARVGEAAKSVYWRERADVIRKRVLEAAWSEKRGAFTGAYGGEALDASVLLMAEIGFLPAEDPRYIATVERIDAELRQGDNVFRYLAADDFGEPKTAFTACTFWHIDALARIGRRDEATAMFENVLARRTRLGMLSEDVDPKTGELWGNFPQTYSMVGIVNAAARLSRSWEDVA
ncbi:MAG: glycoside hydrolase family 15 protein [Pseudomonadota bacterium]